MIQIHCPTCQKEYHSCRSANNGLNTDICNNDFFDQLAKEVKRLKIKTAVDFNKNMAQFSFLYSVTPGQSQAKIWNELCQRNPKLDNRTVPQVISDSIRTSSDATDKRLELEAELAPQLASETANAVDKVKMKFDRLLAAA